MPPNPLKTRKEWQKLKTKYGIPDKVIKSGSFGEKLDVLKKKYDGAGLQTLTLQNAKKALSIVDECDKLFDEWKARAGGRTKEFTDYANAVAEVEQLEKQMNSVREAAWGTLNPIGMSQRKWDDFNKLWKTASKDRTAAGTSAAEKMYTHGIRNYLGQGFNLAYKQRQQYNLSSEVVADLAQYQKLAARWLNVSTVDLADDTKRTAFWRDMDEAHTVARKIFKKQFGVQVVG